MSEDLRKYREKLAVQTDIANSIQARAMSAKNLPEDPAYKNQWEQFSLAMAQIEAVEIAHTPTISESEFVRFLLPVIDQLSKGSEDVDLTIWDKMAGARDRPISVLDDKTGELLFRLPPVFGTSVTIQGTDPRARIAPRLEEMMNADMVFPGAGNRVLINEVFPRLKVIGESEEFKAVWGYVAQRYNLVANDPNAPQAAEDDDDEFEDDEVI